MATHIEPTEVDRANRIADVRAHATQTVREYFGGRVPRPLRERSDEPVGPLAEAIARSKHNNDMEFSRSARPHAASRQSVALVGSSLQVGQSMAFSRQDAGPVPLIQGVSQAVGPLPDAAEHGNIKELAIFMHGSGRSLLDGGGGGRDLSPGRLASEVGPSLTRSVNIQLYACNAASEGGFADELARQLAEAGHDSRIFGHTSAAHATQNAEGRTVVGHAGGATEGATNLDLLFPASFVAEQKLSLVSELGLTEDTEKQAWLDQHLREMMNRWALPGRGGQDAIHRITIPNATGDGAARDVTIAQGLGTEPAAAVAAVQDAWRSGTSRVVRGAEFQPLRDGIEGRVERRRRRA